MTEVQHSGVKNASSSANGSGFGSSSGDADPGAPPDDRSGSSGLELISGVPRGVIQDTNALELLTTRFGGVASYDQATGDVGGAQSREVEILNFMKNRVDLSGDDTSFYVVDLGEVVARYNLWVRELPRVRPFFAIKCNPDPNIIRTLAALGAGFDCASRGEIEAVMKVANVPAKDIIFANPTKPPTHIDYAKSVGVDLFTFDNADELRKLKDRFPTARAVMRIATDDSESVCKFSSKFGARPHETSNLLRLAKELEIRLEGISFHAGSGCGSLRTYTIALERARALFDEHLALNPGKPMSLLDMGGGYPGSDDRSYQKITFAEIAAHLRIKLDELFPANCGVTVIAEPGRFFVAKSHTLAVAVTSKREMIDPVTGEQSFMYYITDGVYQSFNCIVFDHYRPTPHMLVRGSPISFNRDKPPTSPPRSGSPDPHAPKVLSKIWGPTCDSIDLVCDGVELEEMNVGDWMVFKTMGAYTIAAASRFNGFYPKTFYVY